MARFKHKGKSFLSTNRAQSDALSAASTSASSTPNLSSLASHNTPPMPSSTSKPQQSTSLNKALDLAVKRHIDRLDSKRQNAFRNAYMNVQSEDLLERVKAYDKNHVEKSWFRPKTENATRFLKLLDRLMTGTVVAIQADPAISSLVIGGVRLVLDIALSFLEYFDRLTVMLCRFGDFLAPLEQYSISSDAILITNALADVYGDLLRFCGKVQDLFEEPSGRKKTWVSWRLFWHNQWIPFEEHFGTIDTSLQHHIQVLGIATGGVLMSIQEERETKQAVADREQLLRWLSMKPLERIHADIHEKKHPGTGDWITADSKFQMWFNSPTSSLLWCHGKPGAGKTVLASHVLEYITRAYALSNDVGVGFYYYSYLADKEQDLADVVPALIKQFCQKHRGLPSSLLTVKQNGSNPSVLNSANDLVTTSKECSFTEMFIVIDGLDEHDSSKRRKTLEFLLAVLKLGVAKIFVTSRRERDIRVAFEKNHVPTIQIEAKNVEADIRTYVENEIKRLRKDEQLFLHDNDVEQKLIDALTAKAEGMFLWVNLQLAELCKVSECRKDAVVLEAIDGLPSGIDETYLRILRQIESKSKYLKQIALRCMTWLCYARRPLTLKELVHAVSFEDVQTSCQNVLDLEIIERAVIVEACSTLVVFEDLNPKDYYRFYANENYITGDTQGGRYTVVQFIHYSAKEFLIGSASANLITEFSHGFLGQPEVVHGKIADLCMSYLLAAPTLHEGPYMHYQFTNELFNRCKHIAFAWYCAKYFDTHLVDSVYPTDVTLAKIRALLSQSEHFLGSILQLHWLNPLTAIAAFHADILPDMDPVDASIFLCALDIYGLPAFQKVWEGTKPPKYGLHRAVKSKSYDLTTRLLYLGLDVDERDKNGRTSLQIAVKDGNLDIARLLLENGADIAPEKCMEHVSTTLLQDACMYSSTSIVRLLLDHGANVNAPGKMVGTALNAALCVSSTEQIGNVEEKVELLLAKGADPNPIVNDINVFSPLWLASFHGHEVAVEFLLEKGAKVETESIMGRTAIHAAAQSGRQNIVDLLLSRGAKVDETVVEAACRANRNVKGTVELLFSKIRNSNNGGEDYGPALQAACYNSYRKYLRYVHAKGGNLGLLGFTPLEVETSSRQEKEVIELLLSKGANVNHSEDYPDPPLTAACSNGEIDIVELLLSRGANVNAIGDRGSALSAACFYGRIEIAKSLLLKGADITAGRQCRTPLSDACKTGQIKIVELLLSNGAEVNTVNEKCDTALQLACKYGRKTIVQLLLRNGAKINAIGGNYGTAMHAASHPDFIKIEDQAQFCDVHIDEPNSVQEMVEVLLSNGADIGIVDGKLGTDLRAVCASGADNSRIVDAVIRHQKVTNEFECMKGYHCPCRLDVEWPAMEEID